MRLPIRRPRPDERLVRRGVKQEELRLARNRAWHEASRPRFL